jgi:hypothetical protein
MYLNVAWLICLTFVPLKVPEMVMCAYIGLVHLPHTELTHSEISCQLSQRRIYLTFKIFNNYALSRLTWSLTLCWLSWHGVSLGIDSVDRGWHSTSTESVINVGEFKNKLKVFKSLFSLSYISSVHAKTKQKFTGSVLYMSGNILADYETHRTLINVFWLVCLTCGPSVVCPAWSAGW